MLISPGLDCDCVFQVLNKLHVGKKTINHP